MRLLLKILSLPLLVVTGILYGFCKFLVLASGDVLGVLSGIVFLIAIGIFFTASLWGGLAWR